MTASERAVWLEYPVRVTANSYELKQGLDLDSPELLARDYRFHPRLELVTEEEIRAGYEPSPLDIHYAKYLKHTVDGQVRTQDFMDRTADLRRRLAQARMISQLGAIKHKLPLTKAGYRRLFISVAEVEIDPQPGRFAPWDDDPKGYELWLNLLGEHVEIEPSAYGDLRLQRYCQLLAQLIPFCQVRATTDRLIFPEARARTIITELKRLDRMIIDNVKFHDLMVGIDMKPAGQPATDNGKEGKTMAFYRASSRPVSRHMIRVINGKFHSVPQCEIDEPVAEKIEQEQPQVEIVPEKSGLISLAEAKANRQVYRLTEDGDYTSEPEVKREPKLPLYIDSAEDFMACQSGVAAAPINNVHVNVSVAQPNYNAPFVLRQPWEVEGMEGPTSDDDGYEDDDDGDDNREEDDPYEDDDIFNEETAEKLLRKHDKLLAKYEKTNPKKRKKVIELERSLDEIEMALNALKRKGVTLPYRYRKRTWWSKFVRTVKWGIKNLWDKVLDNLDVIAPIIIPIAAALGIGGVRKGVQSPPVPSTI